MYKLMPQRYKKGMKELLQLSGSRRTPKSFFNLTLILSLIVGAGAGFLVQEYMLLVGVGLFAGIFALLHGLVVLAVDRRASFVENVLPDALQLMAANSRAGYIPSRSLMMSARKEFGPLSDAIKRAGKDMLTGDSVEDALKGIPKHIKSKLLEKTVNLIVEGSRSGGQFATLLDENAEDIRRVQVLDKEVKANVMMYTIFIGFAGAIAAPLLYSLSSFLINTLGGISGGVEIPEETFSTIPFVQFGSVAIDPGFLFMFSIAAILITTFFGGILLGSISSGSEKAGIKYVPLFMIVAFTIFFIANIFISSLFGNFALGL